MRFTKEEIEGLVDEMVDKIAFSPKAVRESAERCTSFLTTCAMLADFKRSRDVDRAKAQTVVDIELRNAMDRSVAKQVTEKKMDAQADSKYTVARQALEEIEADISWSRTLIGVFENAHVTYRQIAKEE
jgi:hypothetical protein